MAEPLPTNLLKPLLDLGRWLDAIKAQAVVVGGVAVSVLGRPRFTQDIDALALISEPEWSAAVDAAANYGIVPRIDGAVEFARQSRVLLLKHLESSIEIDIILGGLPFEEDAVMNAQRYVIGGVSIRLPKVEDLMIMKAVAHRPRDLQDIEGLLETHPDLDLRSVRQWVREFASVTAMSDVIDDFDKLLARLNRTP